MTLATASLLTLTVTEIGGYADPAASASLRVHVSVRNVQFHPEPAIAVAVSPAGIVSITVTSPLVGPLLAALLPATIVYTAPVWPCTKSPLCFLLISSP